MVQGQHPRGAGEATGPAAHRCVVVGVGLNLATPVLPDLAATLPENAVSGMAPVAPAGLHECLPELDAGGLLLRLLPSLARDLHAFEALGFEAFAQRFAQRDALAGQAVRTSDGLEGQACGVGTDGCLRLLTAAGMREIGSAEVSVRPC